MNVWRVKKNNKNTCKQKRVLVILRRLHFEDATREEDSSYATFGGQINVAHIVRASPLNSACSQKKSQWKNIWIRICLDETENILNSRNKRHVQAVINCHSYNGMQCCSFSSFTNKRIFKSLHWLLFIFQKTIDNVFKRLSNQTPSHPCI